MAIKLNDEQYKFFKDRLDAVSLVMEGILQQHPVAKINPDVKDNISEAVDKLWITKELINKKIQDNEKS